MGEEKKSKTSTAPRKAARAKATKATSSFALTVFFMLSSLVSLSVVIAVLSYSPLVSDLLVSVGLRDPPPRAIPEEGFRLPQGPVNAKRIPVAQRPAVEVKQPLVTAQLVPENGEEKTIDSSFVDRLQSFEEFSAKVREAAEATAQRSIQEALLSAQRQQQHHMSQQEEAREHTNKENSCSHQSNTNTNTNANCENPDEILIEN